MKELQLNPALSQAIGGLKATEWAKLRARDLLSCSGQSESNSINLEPILEIRKIRRPIKSVENLQGSAKLVPDKDGFKILVNSTLKGKYKRSHWRFTLAHEIGHTFFYDLEASPPKRLPGLGMRNFSEEKLCDLFAAELLMAEGLVIRAYNDLKEHPILSIINMLARSFNVSFDAMSIRLISSLKLWFGILLVCKWIPKEGYEASESETKAWRIYWTVVPESLSEDIYIPRPLPYRKFYPSIKWSNVESIASELNKGETRKISVNAKEVGRVGNLRKILSRHLGDRSEYPFLVTVVDIGDYINKHGYLPAKKKTIAFAISLDSNESEAKEM